MQSRLREGYYADCLSFFRDLVQTVIDLKMVQVEKSPIYWVVDIIASETKKVVDS